MWRNNINSKKNNCFFKKLLNFQIGLSELGKKKSENRALTCYT